MKPKSLSERGQALILIAFASIALFLIAGLAIDGSHKYSDRRHAQNAADTAALAGALAFAKGDPQWQLAALDRARDNGYNELEVDVYNPPVSGMYSGANCVNSVHYDCDDFVQVIITSHKATWFMRIIGIDDFTNVVSAVASKISETDYFDIGGSAVVALSPDGCALMSQGGTNVKVVGGGLYSNSDDSTCSFKKDSCAGVTNIDADASGTQGLITMVGGASINTGCPPDAGLSPAGAQQLPFPPPYQEIAQPAVCSQPLVNITGNPTTVTLSPGHYGSMPPKPNIKDITLQPGVYCIDTEIRVGSHDSFVVSGTFPTSPGVFLYIKPGGSFTFNAGSKTVIWGIHDVTSPYFGYVIYTAPNYRAGSPATCTINGGSLSTFQGTIYAPYCSITLNGGSSPTGFQSQVIGYTVKFAGNSDIYLTYNSASRPEFNIPLQVGLAK